MSTTEYSLNRIARAALPLLTAAATLLAAVPAQAQQLLAPNAPVAGFSQAELAGKWAQWLSSYPASNSPILDTTGALSAAGDQGSYFYLFGSGSADPVVRDVTVQRGQTLFIDITAVIDWGLPTEQDLRDDAAFALGVVSNLSLTVDGVPLAMPVGFLSLDQFRQGSPVFTLDFIDDNIFGQPPGTSSDAIVDGYFVAIDDLPVGQFELRWTALSTATGPYTGFTFAQDITYRVTVIPEPATWAIAGLALLGMGAARRRQRAGAK